MDIDEIRRVNIRLLETDAGSATAMAELVGMSYAQYANTRDGAKEAKTGKKRGMRKETAWRFEDACKKPRGWLDQVHEAVETSPLQAQLAQRLAAADAATVKLIELALYEGDATATAQLSPSLVAMVRGLKAAIQAQTDNEP